MGMHLPKAATPLAIASAVAVFGMWAMLIVDHGPWRHPVLNMKVAQSAPAPAVEPGPGEPLRPKWSSGLR
jgi:hypothetical protein